MGTTYKDLPQPGKDDQLYTWIYDYVHANYAEHYAHLYDRAADGSISLAIALTYDAVRKLLFKTEDNPDTDISGFFGTDDDDDDDDGVSS